MDTTSGGYTLAQLQKAYDVTPLYAVGYCGQGQTVAIVIVIGNLEDAAVRRNVAQFSAFYQLPQPDVQYVHVAGDAIDGVWDLEATTTRWVAFPIFSSIM